MGRTAPYLSVIRPCAMKPTPMKKFARANAKGPEKEGRLRSAAKLGSQIRGRKVAETEDSMISKCASLDLRKLLRNVHDLPKDCTVLGILYNQNIRCFKKV